MLKELIIKEIKLSWHETTYIFFLMAVMLLIPNYPMYVAFFFPCLGLFYMFLNGREQNDLYFTSLLPISKSNIVKSRFISIIIIQMLQVVISIPFAIVRNSVLGLTNAAGIEANPAFYGLVLVMFSLFNLIFLPMFYKSPAKVGVPFVIATAVQFLFIILCEGILFIVKPLGAIIDTAAPDMMVKQLPITLIGLALYIIITYFTYKKSARSFDQLDL